MLIIEVITALVNSIRTYVVSVGFRTHDLLPELRSGHGCDTSADRSLLQHFRSTGISSVEVGERALDSHVYVATPPHVTLRCRDVMTAYYDTRYKESYIFIPLISYIPYIFISL